LGVLFIALGYWGVANHALVAKQLPYLASGAVLGIGLIVLGTFYLATEELRRDSGRLDRLERMVTELHAVLLARPDAPSRGAVEGLVAWGGGGAAGGVGGGVRGGHRPPRGGGRPPPGRPAGRAPVPPP